jgi:FkbM family methyltransferase
LLWGFENPIQIVKIFLNLIRSGGVTIRLRRQKLQFKARGAMDVWSIKETFLDRFYETRGFTIQPNWKIIDIGAGIGEFTLFAAMHPTTQVFAFEPYPGSFELLQENVRLNGMNNARAFDEAIDALTGELTLDLTSGEPLQFQSQPAQESRGERGITVPSLSLADVLAKLDLESCDLLKLDCEGAEYAILFNAPPSTLDRIQRIVMEYHNTDRHTHKDLILFFVDNGFQVETFPNPVHAHLGYLRAIRNH